jgi:acyl-CoA reductase-like NAD-dependent aldehyde dehydrogenase
MKLVSTFIQAVLDRRGEFAEAITLETGKTIKEARLEVEAGVAEARTNIELWRDEGREIFEGHEIVWRPLGSMLLVTPFNFPLAAVLRKLVPALLAGNTVIVKPSELTPVTSCLLFECVDAAGFEPGVANMVLGQGAETVPVILDHPATAGVSLTGSVEAGDAIAGLIGKRNIRYQAELGGSNVTLVLSDADLDLAVKDILANAFACAGQWCTRTARVIVEAKVHDDMLAKLLAGILQLKTGNGLSADVQVGALASAKALAGIEVKVAQLRDKGAWIVAGGRRPDDPALLYGHYWLPTLVAEIPDFEKVGDEEIFGPVLLLGKAKSVEDGIRIANCSAFGFSASVYTRDEAKGEVVLEQLEAGLCHLNLPTGFREFHMPLSGWKASSRGQPECGRFAREFNCRAQSVYRRCGQGENR